MRELMLLRHGKSDWRVGVSDFHRPLRDRGKRAAQQIGNWLKEQAVFPDMILSSTAERAYATAEKASRAMGLDARKIEQVPALYMADLQQHLNILADLNCNLQCVMLVAHNPGLEALLQYLVEPKPQPQEDGKIMPTATLARILLPDDWRNLAEGAGRLGLLLRPKALPELFACEGHNGKELRPKPAYYYTQSALIPYRYKNAQLQILIVRSSVSKQWGVPMGIVDPGLSPGESAQKLAWKEAGVKGQLHEKALGHYQYFRWQAECKVSVYSLCVNEQIDKGDNNSIRELHWVSVEQALQKLKSAEIAALVERLAERKEADK